MSGMRKRRDAFPQICGEVMPKITPFPRLRSHTRKGVGGNVWTSWYFDMRQEGTKDVPLGSDYAQALVKWRELTEGGPRIAGTLQEAINGWREKVLPGYTSDETRKGYARNLKTIEAWCGAMTWDAVKLPMLKQYLQRRTAKTQGNREMSVLQIVWNWARTEGMTELPWPAHGMEKSKWKNKEQARTFTVTDAVFDAVYRAASPMLRDAMDIATATGLRLTDVRELLMPTNGTLFIRASKTGKLASFDIASSSVLTGIAQQRSRVSANHLMLLTSASGKPVSARMLRESFETSREAAATHPANAAIAADIRAMFMRDLRKRAAELAEDMEAASKLLQHGSKATTEKHYRRGDKLKAVR